MKVFFYLSFCIPFFVKAQEKGIIFEKNLNWQEIRNKAKAENKYIFVNCYTTWSVPSKEMDNEVFSKDNVGDFMNEKFISVRVQLDSSKQDNDATKAWYGMARTLIDEYKISTYPTFSPIYFFFSPDGLIVHKGIHAQKAKEFIYLASCAIDSSLQYYSLVKLYQEGKMSYKAMPYLANKADSLGERNLAMSIANDYIHNWLEKLPQEDLFTKENFDFINPFITQLSSNDRIFEFCLHQSSKIDSVEQEGYSKRLVNAVIIKEEIINKLIVLKNNRQDPRWEKISHTIKRKYGNDFAEDNVMQAKVNWYRDKKEWQKYATSLLKQVEINDPKKVNASYLGAIYLNNNAFEIFKYSNNKKELETALSWIGRALPMISNPPINIIDTKANLLYKLGRKVDGIALEGKAAALAPDDEEIQAGFEKMKKGLPTWPTELQ